ncbi:MAG: sugar transferase [Eubacteriales bacterium]|nr:sugar transferase [Eubacteriales bacterium]
MYKKYIKRLLDILLSLGILAVLSPLFVILIVLVREKLGSPVFFRQERPGLGGRIFTLYKFRTMTDERDENGELLPDGDRLTPFGKFLRSTSLDELPEFLNILKGDMSFIGPRPLLVSYLPYYTPEESLRHTVRPGLTGLAQVSGRNFLDWDRRLQKDVEYVKNLSFKMDLRVLLLTVKVVLDRSEVAEDTGQTEGNFARIRQERLERTGHLEPEKE